MAYCYDLLFLFSFTCVITVFSECVRYLIINVTIERSYS